MDFTKLNTKTLISFTTKIILAWFCLIILCVFFSHAIFQPFLFFFESIIDFVTSGLSSSVTILKKDSENLIRLIVDNNYPILSLSGKVILPTEQTMYVNAHNLTLLTPIIILLSVIISWPFQTFKEFYIRNFVGILLSCLVLLMSVPFQLLGTYERQIWVIANQQGEQFIRSPIYYWQVFCDSGGVWLFAILGAMISISFAKWQTKHP